MKLKMLLLYMAGRMSVLMRAHPEFIAKLHGRDFVLQMSSDEGTSRYFQIKHNRVLSRSGAHSAPDLTLQFANDEAGFRLLSRGAGNDFMVAVQVNEVKLIGDYALLMWFMSIGRYLRPESKRRRGGKIQAAA